MNTDFIYFFWMAIFAGRTFRLAYRFACSKSKAEPIRDTYIMWKTVTGEIVKWRPDITLS